MIREAARFFAYEYLHGWYMSSILNFCDLDCWPKFGIVGVVDLRRIVMSIDLHGSLLNEQEFDEKKKNMIDIVNKHVIVRNNWRPIALAVSSDFQI